MHEAPPVVLVMLVLTAVSSIARQAICKANQPRGDEGQSFRMAGHEELAFRDPDAPRIGHVLALPLKRLTVVSRAPARGCAEPARRCHDERRYRGSRPTRQPVRRAWSRPRRRSAPRSGGPPPPACRAHRHCPGAAAKAIRSRAAARQARSRLSAIPGNAAPLHGVVALVDKRGNPSLQIYQMWFANL